MANKTRLETIQSFFPHVLARLAEGAEHFLGVHDCDCHRWESLQTCLPLARSYVYSLRVALAAPADGEEGKR